MRRIKCLSFIFLIFCSAAFGQTGEFTYQGRLVDGSLAASGTYEMRFRLFDAETDGTQQPQPTPITLDFTIANGNAVVVSNGIFTVKLDFTNAAFPGAARFLEISVRRTASDPFTLLNPRQPITSAPHNIRSLSSGLSDGLSVACVLCVTDAQIQSIDGSKVTGSVANATNAATANNVSGVVAIANGGTGSSTKNFVDLSTNQNVSGNKTFNNATAFNGAVTVAGTNNKLTVDGSLNVGFNVTADQFHGGGDGLFGINGSALVDGTISTPKLADGSVTSSKLAAGTTVGSTTNSSLLGSLRWDLLTPKNFAVGSIPFGIAFDGANIWVANSGSNNVTKLRVLDGALQGTFAVVNSPRGIAFDGANIWVANNGSGNVTKLRASDGALQGTFAVGSNPFGVAFDGANIWVANNGSINVTKLRASDGALQGTFAVGSNPFGVAFDGANIWVVNANSNNVTKLRASDGACVGTCTFAVGIDPRGVAFDGANIWVANTSSDNVTKLRASDGTNLGTFSSLGFAPQGIAFDGANIWVANNGSNNVTKLRASDGAPQDTFAVGIFPRGVAFDGANIWVANQASNNVTKLPVFP